MQGAVKRPVLQWLIYGHVWVALAVGAQTFWTTLFVQEGAWARSYAWAAMLGSFAGYGVMRLARVHGPEGKEYENLLWYGQHRLLLHVLVGVAALIAFVLLWPLWPIIWKWVVPASLTAFLYVTPFTSKNGRGIGLRTIPYMKAFVIAILWAVITVAVPLELDPDGHSTFTILALACMRVPFILSLAIVFDIRDQRSDDPALRTMPMVFGTNGAKVLALFFLLCSAFFEVIFLRGLGQVMASWTILIGYAFAAVLIAKAKPVRDAVYYAMWVDGAMIVVPLCVWLGMVMDGL